MGGPQKRELTGFAREPFALAREQSALARDVTMVVIRPNSFTFKVKKLPSRGDSACLASIPVGLPKQKTRLASRICGLDTQPWLRIELNQIAREVIGNAREPKF
jgi:hypothetical protein